MLFCPCQFLHEVDLPKGAQSPGPNPVQNRETAAHDPSALLAAIVTSSEDAIVSKTLDGIITTWNAGAARLYGYSETEAVGKPISMLAPPERADEIPSILQKIKNGERIEHYKSVRVTKNGRRLSVSITISPIRDAEGEIVGASAIARDVTELDQVRSNLQETASRAQALFQTAAQAIFIVDSSGTIVMANTATQAMFGYTVEELIGRSVDLLIPEQLRGRHKQHRDSYFERPQSRPMGVGLDLQGRRNDGTEFAAEISLSYMASSQGMLGVAFVSDISKRRADELAILRQREDLRALAAQLVSAQEDERRRIARNLHDDLGQTLAHLSIDMGRLAANPLAAEITAELRQLQQRANQAS
jgi:PAS domain S-box-containing protein